MEALIPLHGGPMDTIAERQIKRKGGEMQFCTLSYQSSIREKILFKNCLICTFQQHLGFLFFVGKYKNT